MLNKFVELGGTTIDTANVYSNGESERIVGTWLAKNKAIRSKLVVMTKLRFPMPLDASKPDAADVNCVGLSRKHVREAVSASLERLQTDYIDVIQTHAWDEGTPLEETYGALHDLTREGKIMYVGVSNVLGWQLQKIVDELDRRGIPRIASLQAQYSLLCRQTEWELQDVCRREGVALLPWSPLKGGWLSGKFKRDAMPEGTRVATAEKTGKRLQSHPGFSEFNNESTWALLDAMKEIADAHDRTVAQVAIRWLLQREAVPAVVIGARTMAHMLDNMGAAGGWTLSAEEMDRLTKLSEPAIPYPYEMCWRVQGARLRDGVAAKPT